jgi:hypothetical protein
LRRTCRLSPIPCFSHGIVSVAATGSILQLNQASVESALDHRIEDRPEKLTSKKGPRRWENHRGP